MSLAVPAFAATEEPVCDQAYIDAKFNELFPEYQDYIQACDTASAQAAVAAMSLEVQEKPVLTESVVRMDGDDAYTLNLYSDGGYDKIALTGGTAKAVSGTVAWVSGSGTSKPVSNGVEWTGRTVHAYGRRASFPYYYGGIIGYEISYTLLSVGGGFFPRSGNLEERYGIYYNTGVYSGDNDNTTFLETGDSYVIVAGIAEFVWYNGDIMHIEGTPSILTIDLNQRDSSGNPVVTFDIP